MTPLLPGASTPPESSSATEPARAGAGRAWQREMERAQAATWFHAGLPTAQAVPLPQPGAASPLPREAGEPGADQRAGQACDTPHQDSSSWRDHPLRGADAMQPGSPIHAPPRTGIAAGRAATMVPGSVAPSPMPAQPLRPGPPLLPGLSTAAGWLALPNAVRSPMAAAASLARAPEPAAPPPPEAPGPRIHVEEGPAGLQVWLGIDGDEAQVAARAASILAELRRAPAFAGQRLASLVCNGTTVYALAAPTPASQRQEP